MPTFLTRFNHASFGIDTIYSLNADLELFSREVVREALERGIDPRNLPTLSMLQET